MYIFRRAKLNSISLFLIGSIKILGRCISNTMCITKIRKLEQSLQTQEQYIKYLYTIIDGYEAEIEELRCQNKKLRISLKNALKTIIPLKDTGRNNSNQLLIDHQ